MSTFPDPDSVRRKNDLSSGRLIHGGSRQTARERRVRFSTDGGSEGKKVQGLSETLNIGEFAAWMEEEAREKVISQRGSKPS